MNEPSIRLEERSVRRVTPSMPSGRWLKGLIAICALAFARPMPRAEASGGDDAGGLAFFERRIRPLLAERCYQCHGAESKKANGGLRLDSAEGLLKGSDSGPVVVAGATEKSLLIEVVRSKNEDV